MDLGTTLVTRASNWLGFSGPGARLFVAFLGAFGLQPLSVAQKTKPPAEAEVIYAQGMQALQQGDLLAAQTAFEKVLRLAPGSAEAHNSLGWVLLAQEKIDPPIPQFHPAIKLNS